MRTRFPLLIPMVALAAALTACGDSGPSKAEFTKKADGSCSAGNTAISGIAKPTNPPQVATAAGTAASTIDGQVAALRAIKAPGGKDKQQVSAVIGAIGEVSAPTKALQEAAGKNDDVAMGKATADMQSKVDAAATQAQAYGLAQCGTGLKPAVANLSDGSKTLVKAAYVKKGEAACNEASRKANALAQPGSTLASLSKFTDSYLPIANKLVADLKALPAPPGDEATTAEMTGALEASVGKIKEFGAAAKANNPKLVAALSQDLDVSSTGVNAKFDAYGLKACGSLSEF